MEQSDSNVTLGELSEKRTEYEKNFSLARLFDKLDLKSKVLTGREIIPKSDHWKGTIIEAIIGSVYLDGGIDAVKRFLKGWRLKML